MVLGGSKNFPFFFLYIKWLSGPRRTFKAVQIPLRSPYSYSTEGADGPQRLGQSQAPGGTGSHESDSSVKIPLLLLLRSAAKAREVLYFNIK